MIRIIAIMTVFLCIHFSVQAEPVSLTGTVKKTRGSVGISGVKVGLLQLKHLSTTTNTDGAFAISGSTPIQLQKQENRPLQFVLKGNVIIFSPVSQTVAGSIDIFSSDGKRKTSTRFIDSRTGKQSVTLPELNPGINIMRLNINGESYMRTLVCLGKDLFLKKAIQNNSSAGNFTLAKHMTTTAVDTIVAEKETYVAKKIAINGYNEQNIAISLDSVGETPGPCTRQVLQAAAESYIEAQKAGDPSKMSLASQVKYIENLDTITADKSICKKALPIAFHRDFLDVDSCRTFSEVIVTGGGHPYIIGTRLRVQEGKISEIDAIVTDSGDWGFNVKVYYDSCTKQSWDTLPVAQRSTRQTLINCANAYGSIFEVPHTDTIPFGTPCSRVEGGMGTNNCHMGFPTGKTNHQLADRDFVVDETMGTINMFCYLVIESIRAPDSHLIRMVNGKIRYVHTLTIWGN